MSAELIPVSLSNLPDVISVMNVSSRDAPVSLSVDISQFLAMSRFWDFSYPSCFMAYIDRMPAGVILNCIEEREAYTFYCGVAPAYRNRRVSFDLLQRFLEELRGLGTSMCYAETASPRALDIWQRTGFHIAHELIQYEAHSFAVPRSSRNQDVRATTADRLFSEWPLPEMNIRSWKTRRRFLTRISPWVHVIECREAGGLAAYMFAARWPGQTLILDFDCLPNCDDAGSALLAHLKEHDYPLPLIAPDILPGTAVQALLESSGFQIDKRASFIALDLTV